MTEAILYICGAIITIFLLLIVQTFTLAVIAWRWGFLPPAGALDHITQRERHHEIKL